MDKYKNIIEAILFASGDAIFIKEIAKAINKDEKETKSIILSLKAEYENANRGIKIIEIEDKVQLCTNPEYFPYLKSIFGEKGQIKISKPVLETLAIIAYKQPITKAQIEGIRGVNSDHCVNTLIKYNLIEEKGRLDIVGKPIIFGTTDEFFKYFGLSSIEELANLVNNA